ncbi:MAG: type VI secretion system contractile sheath large subunit [Holosporaceae bacterium]|jgi:type VI secretion system protein ImpC|nr:type VI secretion system contractile sheath large subunit [Holosporaceae bacterium]
MVESTQHVLDRVRSPRVHITYDVEIGNAIIMKELPFVIGVMADLSGMPVDPLPPIKFRKFVEIDRDNLPEFMISINPRLAIQVKDTLGDGSENLNAELFFKHMDDFGPISIAKQVPKLNKIYQSRIKLNDLLVKMEGNDVLQQCILDIVADSSLKLLLKSQIDVVLKANKQTVTADFATTPSPGGAKDETASPKIDGATPPAAEGGTADAGSSGGSDGGGGDAEKPTREILKEMFVPGKLAREPSAEVYACGMILELLYKIEEAKVTTIKNPLAFVEKIVANTDAKLSTQINEILHHLAFQELEGLWRALHYLIMNTETSTHLKIRVMNVSKKDMLDDLENAVEFDQSQLFKKVYEEEYGTFGGHPYSCLIGGYEFTRHPQDILLMEKISNVAAAAHAPFIAAAHPRMFDMESFSHLAEPRDVSKIFESTEMIKWRSFRDSEDSRYIALVLPRVLMRLPYGPDTLPVDGMNYVESIDGTDNSQFCWGNAAFILGQRIGYAVSLHKWPAAIRGVEGGGLVEGLPAYTFKTTDGDIALKCPTEISITDRREKELTDMGFLAVCHSKGTDYAAFFGGQTTQKPKVYNTDDANANASLSARLPYLLAASRFAHYIKAIMRDKIGSFLTKDNVSNYLNNWIASYVLLNDAASQDLKARFPLREARIDVYDVPGKPGSYKATIYLRPHFQLEELTASIRLVAALPPPAK